MYYFDARRSHGKVGGMGASDRIPPCGSEKLAKMKASATLR
ncbi:MAG: hypothetical protein JWP89_774 [Schlesneria sp.]|nr:hypothetical protein [Schlesneria sp.]